MAYQQASAFTASFMGAATTILLVWALINTGTFTPNATITFDYKEEYDALQIEHEELQERFDEYKEQNTPVCQVDCGSTGILYWMLGIIMYILGMATLLLNQPIKEWLKKRKEK